ncbi:hypothetical protein ACMFMG_007050 [Clarireedia jacksonii]
MLIHRVEEIKGIPSPQNITTLWLFPIPKYRYSTICKFESWYIEMNSRTDLKLGTIFGPFSLTLCLVVEGRPPGASAPSDVFQKYNRKFTALLSTVLYILVPTAMKFQLIIQSERNLILYI